MARTRHEARIPFQKRWRAVWVFEKCSRCGMGITDLGGDWEVTTTGDVICEVCLALAREALDEVAESA
jgi:hypothetical protein